MTDEERRALIEESDYIEREVMPRLESEGIIIGTDEFSVDRFGIPRRVYKSLIHKDTPEAS